jgi:hypothetical protein
MQRIAQIGLGKLAILGTIVSVLLVLGAFGQEMFSSGPLSEQNPRKVTRGGVSSHAEIASCSACHAPAWSSDTMASRCMDCHDNIKEQLDAGKAMHGLLAQGQDCTSCHTEHKGPEAVLTSLEGFDHDCAAFKLTGKHRQLDCASCHHDKPFQGTPQSCVACHAEPSVHKGKFGTDCMTCHSPQTWKTETINKELFTSVKFDHECTGFKLTGKHAVSDCKAWHTGNTFKGLAQTCVSCHVQVKPVSHKKNNFGDNCMSCHSTADWKAINLKKESFTSINFDHDTTGFKLTGKHVTADCKSCHTGNTFKGLAQSHSCVSCHANVEPANHKPHPKSFGKNCAECHSTLTWKGVTLVKAHTFPMNHRTKDRKNSACIVCHKDTISSNFVSTPPTTPSLLYATYTCYGCHHHTPEREALRHARRTLKVELNKCATCHKTGGNNRGGKKGRTALEETVGFELCQACPETSMSTGRLSACGGQNPFAGLVRSAAPPKLPQTTARFAPPMHGAVPQRTAWQLPGMQLLDLRDVLQRF